METENIFNRAIERIKQHLQNKGEEGKFILNEIEKALGAGVEDYEETDISNKDKKLITLRKPNEIETLEIYLNTLELYMVILPSCFESLEKYMKERFDVKEVRVSLLPENYSVSSSQEKDMYLHDDFNIDTWEESSKIFEQIKLIIDKYKNKE